MFMTLPAVAAAVPAGPVPPWIKDFTYTLGWQSREGGWSIVAAAPGPAAGQPSHLQEVQAELVSRQFPAGVSPAPGKTGPAPVTDAALASYIRAHA